MRLITTSQFGSTSDLDSSGYENLRRSGDFLLVAAMALSLAQGAAWAQDQFDFSAYTTGSGHTVPSDSSDQPTGMSPDEPLWSNADPLDFGTALPGADARMDETALLAQGALTTAFAADFLF